MKSVLRTRGLIIFVVIGVLLVLSLSTWSSVWATPPQDGLRQTVPTPAPGQVTTDITTASGGTLTTEGLSVTVPTGAITQNETLIVTPLPAAEVPAAGAGFKGLGKAFEIAVAIDGILQPGATFLVPITICFSYTDADVAAAGGNANNIVIQYYDPALNQWVNVPTTVDTAGKKVCIQVTHLTLFQLAANVGPTALPKTGSGGLDRGASGGVNGLIAVLTLAGLVVVASGSYLLRRSIRATSRH